MKIIRSLLASLLLISPVALYATDAEDLDLVIVPHYIDCQYQSSRIWMLHKRFGDKEIKDMNEIPSTWPAGRIYQRIKDVLKIYKTEIQITNAVFVGRTDCSI